jgi:hypothetical protein
MKQIVKITVILGLIAPSVFAQNTAPALVCPEPVTVTCAAANGAPVNLTASVSDLETNALTVVWFIDGVAYQTNDLAAGITATPVAVSFSAQFGTGPHDVLVAVSDGEFVVSCTNAVTIVADAPPVIASLRASPNVLWPPNHKMRKIQLAVEASDACGSVTSRVVSVRSSEPPRNMGKGDVPGDWVMGPGMSLSLRAERMGKSKAGRVYTITVECTDNAGNSSQRTVTVTVPHDNRKKPAKPAKPVRRPVPR